MSDPVRFPPQTCGRCQDGFQRARGPWPVFCSPCRDDLIEYLQAEWREQRRHGHEWDFADIQAAVERWARVPR